jgi:hypothetical protein
METAAIAYVLAVAAIATLAAFCFILLNDNNWLKRELVAERERREMAVAAMARQKASFARFVASRARLERRCLQAERDFVRVSRELRYLRELREDAE